MSKTPGFDEWYDSLNAHRYVHCEHCKFKHHFPHKQANLLLETGWNCPKCYKHNIKYFYTEATGFFNTKIHNKKQWLTTPFTPAQLLSWYGHYGSHYIYSQKRHQWHATALILDHPNCPESIKNIYLKKCFYKRIKVMLPLHSRAKYILQALQDRSYRVRIKAVNCFWQIATPELMEQAYPLIVNVFKEHIYRFPNPEGEVKLLYEEIQQTVDKAEQLASCITLGLTDNERKIRNKAWEAARDHKNYTKDEWLHILRTAERKLK